MTKIYFRADANSQIGWGHIVRCMALADMLISDADSIFECIFLVQNPSITLQNQIKEKFELIILKETTNFLEEAHFITQKYLQDDSIIVLDHYQIQTEYQRIIKENCNSKIVCIDDMNSWHFLVDIIINHGGNKLEKYSCEKYTKLLVGMEYALLRQPFLKAALKKREIKKIETVFICFGGADIYNLTNKVVELVLNFDFIKKINVVVTSDFPFLKELHKLISEHSIITIHQNLDAQKMTNIMQKSDLAFAPASSLSLELLATQPFIILGKSADNQATIYQELISYPQIKGIGEWQNLNWKELKSEFSQICKQFCLETIPIIPNLAPSKIKKEFKKL
ncbi:pseudaminic acid biosynthesis-associated protein PseG [Bernardetia litoralis DSM 6794]|uniref:Pseudaminic acid biosynthesis-associated protein PseG n=1 Tax=Bernardetia litoralis (strain ATCC 23117 / DSM 6794 / NBRC 15988 / NCIMB 1366 / Fx l1 / Sio-4) TaxID=880071 RepID=I4APG9_BERLS|nr:UDP-2,4-diacetamido-2,4,6-trideoxy-beta-L-altropyranose hydrolase [Bernardetia litoralis]AFM05854.1 pseudaminic acid biosynthesis-associated protein PseG [Bernardetia litoralis DSM 6794]